ncbi:hypothetical protein FKM82_022986 [Ascaphus truei]
MGTKLGRREMKGPLDIRGSVTVTDHLFRAGVLNSSPQAPPTGQVLRISLLQPRWLNQSLLQHRWLNQPSTEPLIKPPGLKLGYPENLTCWGCLWS